jgi:adenylate cyclase
MSTPNDPSLTRSEARLWKLIEERTHAEADTKTIDQRIWDLFGEDWTIMMTDLTGFSRHVAKFGIIHFLQVIHEHKKLLLPIVERHDGVLVKIEADSLLVLFKRPGTALDCAIAMQHACQNANDRRVAEERMLLCIGLGCGKVLRAGDSDVYGAEVNAASKLGEDTARTDEILVTHAFHDAIQDRKDISLEPLNIEIPGTDRAFRVLYTHAKP